MEVSGEGTVRSVKYYHDTVILLLIDVEIETQNSLSSVTKFSFIFCLFMTHHNNSTVELKSPVLKGSKVSG